MFDYAFTFAVLKFFAVCYGLRLSNLPARPLSTEAGGAEFDYLLDIGQFRHLLAVNPCRHLPKNFLGTAPVESII